MHEPIQERLGFADVRLLPRGPAVDADRLRELGAALMEELHPRRTLVFLDLETTGLDPATDRIVEASFARVEPSGSVRTFETLVRPGIPMPREASSIHGIDDALVRTAPAFAEIAASIRRLLVGADLVGYNLARFDLPMLAAELDRAGLDFDWRAGRVVDACVIFKRLERRDLDAAVRFYCGRERSFGHTASADLQACVEVLLGQLRRYPDLPRDTGQLDALWRPPVGPDARH